MNALQAYTFDASAVRALTISNQPWFVATDVAGILGYRDAEKLTRNLDDDEKDTHIVGTLGGDQALSIINESGLYHAIFKSRRPEAQRFRKWVTSEVLPAIRQTGRYDARDDFDQLLARVEMVREARETFGKNAAKRIWEQLALPSPHAIYDELDDWHDPLLDALEPWLRVTPEPVSVTDVIDGLALKQRGAATRRRIGKLLRQLGRHPIVVRRNGRVEQVFVAPRAAIVEG